MELEEFYKQVGGNFEDVKRRLFNEEFIRKFVLKFKDDETFEILLMLLIKLIIKKPSVLFIPWKEQVLNYNLLDINHQIPN